MTTLIPVEPNIVHELTKKKVELHVIKQNLIVKDNDMTSKIVINSFAMAAEVERDLISQRTKNGLALAKSRGVKLGNPNLKPDNEKRKKKAIEFAESLRGIITGLVNDGHTQRGITDELNKAGIATYRGGKWNLNQVQRVLYRLGINTKGAR